MAMPKANPASCRQATGFFRPHRTDTVAVPKSPSLSRSGEILRRLHIIVAWLTERLEIRPVFCQVRPDAYRDDMVSNLRVYALDSVRKAIFALRVLFPIFEG